jgi:hypothetical protein
MKPTIFGLFIVSAVIVITSCQQKNSETKNFSKSSSLVDKKESGRVKIDNPLLENYTKLVGEMEYNIHLDPKSQQYTAPNRNQAIRSFFTPLNWSIVPRGDKDNWKLDITINNICSSNIDNTTAIVQLDKNILMYNFEDKFAVKYENKKDGGVEQTFIVNEKEKAAPTVKLNVNTDWHLTQENNQEVKFTHKHIANKQLVYNKLKVWDAKGTILPSAITIADNDILITVDDEKAIYPITIDPSITAVDYQIESNQANSEFGCSVYAAGDVNSDGYSDILIGAKKFDKNFTDEGAVFLYFGSPNGISGNGSNITAFLPDWEYYGGQAGAELGTSVSTAADVNGDGWGDVIIGAPKYDNGAATDAGKVFAFYGAGGDGLNPTPADGDLTNIPQWTYACNQANANFGISIAAAGDVNNDGYSDVIVGANLFDNGQTDEGVALIFRGKNPSGLGGGLQATPSDTLEANQANANFGISVASAGDVNADGYYDVIIGANLYDNGQVDEGVVFNWQFSAVNGFKHTYDKLLEVNQAGANFGISVSTAGDINGDGYADIVAGADLFDNLTNQYVDDTYSLSGLNYKPLTDNGRAFAYHGSSTGLSLTDNWNREGKESNAHFGRVVSSAGDRNGDGFSDIIVGAPNNDVYTYTPTGTSPFYSFVTNQLNSGRIYIFEGDFGGLVDLRDVFIGNVSNLEVGSSVGAGGDINGDGYSDVVFSATKYTNGQTNEGRVYAVYGKPYGLDNVNLDVDFTYEPNIANSEYGKSVASVGDVNGDGLHDFIVGAPSIDNPSNPTLNDAEGGAFVYLGTTGTFNNTPSWTSYGGQSADSMGHSVAGAGDVNGDGYSDIIIGSPYYDQGGFTDNGRVDIYLGSITGLSLVPSWTTYGTANNQQYGSSVACAGDVNLDSYSDIIIGAKNYSDLSGTQNGEGAIYVYHGQNSGPTTTPSTVIEGNQAGAQFGFSIACAGDVNGDGFNDVVVGAPKYNNGTVGQGRVTIYHGSPFGITSANQTLYGATINPNANFGYCVASAGDINGDAFSDIIIGSPFYNQTNIGEGRADVFNGSVTGTSASSSWFVRSAANNFNLGFSVASAGDVNSDGYSDIIVSQPGDSKGRINSYHGSSTGLGATRAWTTTGGASTGGTAAKMGYSIAAIGDMNGDGFGDIVTGSPVYTKGQTNEGVARLYLGGEKRNTPNNVWLFNTDLTTIINSVNASENTFGIAYKGHCFLGSSQGRIAWETKANGVKFFAYGALPMTKYTGQTARQIPFVTIPTTGYLYKQVVLKVTGARTTKSRLRIHYPAVNAITGQVMGPWRYLPGYMGGGLGFWSLPLPISILNFKVQKNNDQIQLQWQLENVENKDKYIVERSTNGVNFTAIDTKELTATQSNTFSFIDNQPQTSSKIYYRIKVVENTGKVTYSEIKIINNGKDNFFVSETSEEFQIQSIQAFSLNVYNAAGALVYTEKYNSGNSSIHKNEITNGISGTYVAQLVLKNNEKIVKRFTITQ